MKHDILESMDRGNWYEFETLAALSGYTVREVAKACLQMVGEGLLEIDASGKKPLARLAMTRRSARQPDYTCVPTVATGRYRPQWTPMYTYDQYAYSHQHLCEEMR